MIKVPLNQPRPHGFLRFQNGGPGEKPLDKAPKYVKHDQMAFSEVPFSDWQPCLFSDNMKPLFKRYEDI